MFKNVIQLFSFKRGAEINKTPGSKKFYSCKCSICGIEKYRSKNNIYESYKRKIITENKNNYKCLKCSAIYNGKLNKTSNKRILKNIPKEFHKYITDEMTGFPGIHRSRLFQIPCSSCGLYHKVTKQFILKIKFLKNYMCRKCVDKSILRKKSLFSDENYLKGVDVSFHRFLSKKRNKGYMRLFTNIPCSKCKSLNTITKYNLKNKILDLYVCKRCQSTLNGKKCRKYPKKDRDRTTTYITLMYRKYGYDKNLWKCEFCGIQKLDIKNNSFPYNTIQVHHIDKNRINNAENNLKLLCFNCHKKEHNYKMHR